MTETAPTPAKRQRALSGIQPTSDSFHLGNYLGAVRQWVQLQDEFETFYFIPNMHGITTPHDPKALRERTVFAVDGDPRTSDDALRFLLTRTDARDVETRTHGLEEAFLQLTEEKA